MPGMPNCACIYYSELQNDRRIKPTVLYALDEIYFRCSFHERLLDMMTPKSL